MVEANKLGSVKRLGARYGRKGKIRLAKIEKVQRGKHQCPYCRAWAVKRLSAGIWTCRKCEVKFTGKAYSTDKLISLDEDVVSRKQQMEKKAEEQEAEDEEMLKENNKKLNVKQKQEENTQYQEEVA